MISMKQIFPTRYIRVQKPSGNVSVHKLTASDFAIANFMQNINQRPDWTATEIKQPEFITVRNAEAASTQP
jgi:hypothetical protein